MQLQFIRNQSTKTFGQLLKPKIKPKVKVNLVTNVNDKIPTGYEYITSNFPNDLIDFKKFMKNNNKKEDKYLNRTEIELLLDNYSRNINLNLNSSLIQKKMILKAYKKANSNKSLNINFPSKNKSKIKLTLLLKRNWPVLKYIANESGIKVLKSEDESGNKISNNNERKTKNANNDNENNENWVIDDDVIKETEAKTKGLKIGNSKDSKGSFKEMLKSINKVSKSHHENVLPKMTKFKPSPSINHSINKIDIVLEKKNFQEFLNNAKKDNDNKKNMLFKSELNYEFSKQLLSDNPRLIERGNFFTPILIPGTTLEMIDNKRAIVRTGDDKLEILKVFKDGYSIKIDTYQLKNIYQIINKLGDPNSFIKIIKKYIRNNWELVDGNENYLIFVRNSTDYYKKNIARILVISCSALLSYLSITYAICIQ